MKKLLLITFLIVSLNFEKSAAQCTPPSITTQPKSMQFVLNGPYASSGGSSAYFQVSATGSGITYQWYSNTVNNNFGGALISGANGSLYYPNVTVPGTTFYYVTVTSSCGSVTSNTAAITATNSGMIQTVAGNGVNGYSGDGGPAAAAQLGYLTDVANDGSGNLYIADGVRVRKVNASTGLITTVAGNGTPGYSGDGGSATSAQLSVTGGIGVDNSGNIYIADASNQRVRKVNASTGIITTVAGNGTFGFSGDGGSAISAQLQGPQDVAVDGSGNLYIADLGNYVIRKVNASTGIITTVAGNGTSGFSGDGGSATSAQLTAPLGVAVDNSGNIYVLDQGGGRIRKINASGTISTIAGGGNSGLGGPAATYYSLLCSESLAVGASGNIYLSSCTYILEINSSGIITWVAGNNSNGYSGDGGLATSASLKGPEGLSVDSQGSFYIADRLNSRVRKVLPCFYTLSSPSTTAQTICQNGTATSLSVAATGTGAFTYQWYSNTTNNNSGGTIISGATATSYLPPSTAVGTKYYYAIVTGTCGSVATNVSGAITVNSTTAITTQPSTSTQTVCQNGALTSLSVAATGTGTLAYQWYKNTTNSNTGGTVVSGAITASYTPSSASAGISYYYVTVTGCNIVKSSPSGAITVNAATAITTQPSTTIQTVCQNGSVSSLSVVASGTAPFTYQWYSNSTNSNTGGTFTGVTTSTYTPSSATVGTKYYYVVVSSACGTAVTSNVSGAIVINPLPLSSITPSGATTFCQGGSVTLTASTGSSYLWSTGATTQSITVGTAGNYTVRVTNVNGCSATSSATTVIVNPLPTATISASGATTFCQGGSVTLTASSGASYLWSTGATTQSITTGAAGNYSVTVTNNGCSSTSAATTVTINPLPIDGTIAASTNSICLGQSVTISSSGGVGTPYYYASTDGGNSWNAFFQGYVGSYSFNYTPTQVGTYRFHLRNGTSCGQCWQIGTCTTYPYVDVVVKPRPIDGTITASATSICLGQSVTISSSGGTGTPYYWASTNGGSSWNVFAGQYAGQSSFGFTPTAAGTYRFHLRNQTACGFCWDSGNNGCPTFPFVDVVVNAIPSVYIAGDGATFCSGSSTSLTAVSSAPYFSWSTGASGTQLSTVNVFSAGTYSVTAYQNGCSSTAQATVYEQYCNPDPPCIYGYYVVNGYYVACPCFDTFCARTEAPGGSEPSDDPNVSELSVFPNPAIAQVTVALPARVEVDTPVRFFDLLGRQQGNVNIPKGQWKVSVSLDQAAEGTYIIKVGHSHKSIKLIVKR